MKLLNLIPINLKRIEYVHDGGLFNVVYKYFEIERGEYPDIYVKTNSNEYVVKEGDLIILFPFKRLILYPGGRCYREK